MDVRSKPSVITAALVEQGATLPMDDEKPAPAVVTAAVVAS